MSQNHLNNNCEIGIWFVRNVDVGDGGPTLHYLRNNANGACFICVRRVAATDIVCI